MRTRLSFVLDVRVFISWGCWFTVACFLFVMLFSWDSELSVMRSSFFVLHDSDRHGMAMQLCAKLQEAVNDFLLK